MSAEQQHAIAVDQLIKYYSQRKKIVSPDGKVSRKQQVKSVDGVSFTLQKGEVLGVIGESGCGKSTLGKLLVRLEEETSGSIRFSGVPSKELHKRSQLAFRRTAQMIFQNPFDTFDPRYTIAELLTDTLKLHKIGGSYDERLAMCEQKMEQAGLVPAQHYLHRYPHELSGGQLQRISILRSMLLSPLFIVADEPVSMLDVSVRADIINMLIDVCQKENTAMVFISHDIISTRYVSDKVAVMYLGRFVEYGPTEEVLHNPKHPYTKALISNSAMLESLEQKREVIRIEGEPPTPINTGPGCYFYSRCYQRRDSCQSIYPDFTDVGAGHKVACPYTS
ncbi:peptide/nickel transport system ATP-binding protein [Paenibacillus algorifonticola]|uniref:Peptide/nickel transport system ATP-binding protein n=1 Tax=Paenibacillus algorifonticola TaxID=684063 RepID=A0A1I2J089_9BACL|nr:oligopeptide/dipeptide ABC transporter ATP-binding protein [Paenibacillus algorifonticola]SFF46677.1 peptide/nickel transport system ATP-binding protein [Paenibacillus algorifonticola]